MKKGLKIFLCVFTIIAVGVSCFFVGGKFYENKTAKKYEAEIASMTTTGESIRYNGRRTYGRNLVIDLVVKDVNQRYYAKDFRLETYNKTFAGIYASTHESMSSSSSYPTSQGFLVLLFDEHALDGVASAKLYYGDKLITTIYTI